MTAALVVFCTCGSPEEASRIANALVDERFAACVNILPPIRSIYRWQGAIEQAEETLLLIKSTTERFPALRDRIHELHSYEVPEIVGVPICEGSAAYLSWVAGEVGR